MLPTELENLVGYYAYGEARYNLSEDIEFCAANRGMVPDSFLEHTLALYGHSSRIGNALACYMVKNPLRTDNPYFPSQNIVLRPLRGRKYLIWFYCTFYVHSLFKKAQLLLKKHEKC